MDVINIQKDYGWVLKVLDSCITDTQIKACENLFSNFISKWSEDLSPERIETFYSNFKKYKSQRIRILNKVW